MELTFHVCAGLEQSHVRQHSAQMELTFHVCAGLEQSHVCQHSAQMELTFHVCAGLDHSHVCQHSAQMELTFHVCAGRKEARACAAPRTGSSSMFTTTNTQAKPIEKQNGLCENVTRVRCVTAPVACFDTEKNHFHVRPRKKTITTSSSVGFLGKSDIFRHLLATGICFVICSDHHVLTSMTSRKLSVIAIFTGTIVTTSQREFYLLSFPMHVCACIYYILIYTLLHFYINHVHCT